MNYNDTVIAIEVEPQKREILAYDGILGGMSPTKSAYQEFTVRFRVFKDTSKYESKDYAKNAIRLLNKFLKEIKEIEENERHKRSLS